MLFYLFLFFLMLAPRRGALFFLFQQLFLTQLHLYNSNEPVFFFIFLSFFMSTPSFLICPYLHFRDHSRSIDFGWSIREKIEVSKQKLKKSDGGVRTAALGSALIDLLQRFQRARPLDHQAPLCCFIDIFRHTNL